MVVFKEGFGVLGVCNGVGGILNEQSGGYISL